MSGKTEEQIQAGIDAAVEKIREALNDYLVAVRRDEIGESITQAFVILEAQGMNVDGAVYFRPGALIVEQTGSPHTALGLLTTQSSALANRVMSLYGSCDHDDD